MSMAGVPPSSADFTPSWLKFNSNKKDGNVTSKDNSYKQAVSQSKNILQCQSVSEVKSQISSEQFDSHYASEKDNAWPHLVGEKSADEPSSHAKTHWPRTSKDGQHRTYSTASKNFSSVVNGIPSSKQRTLDMDFPSLSNNKPEGRQKIKQQSVWSKPLVLKSADNVRNNSNKNLTKDSHSCDASSIYKALVPKSSTASNKQPYRRTATAPSNTVRYNVKTSTKTNVTHKNQQSRGQKDTESSNSATSRCSSTIEDQSVSSAAVKRHLKGKNVFLKELRRTDLTGLKETSQAKSVTRDCGKETGEENFNNEPNHWPAQQMTLSNESSRGKDGKEIDLCEASPSPANEVQKDWWEEVEEATPEDDSASQSKPPLSSSLEEEYRFLRQMGWTDGDDGANGDTAGSDESPLTDAEIREFFLNYKKKGLLTVSSSIHRETALRAALSTWLLSGPVMRRSANDKIKKSHLSPCSTASSSDFSNFSSSGMDSD